MHIVGLRRFLEKIFCQTCNQLAVSFSCTCYEKNGNIFLQGRLHRRASPRHFRLHIMMSNNYLFFCAKPERNGYSNFSSTYNEHLKHAKNYQTALNMVSNTTNTVSYDKNLKVLTSFTLVSNIAPITNFVFNGETSTPSPQSFSELKICDI